MKLSCSFVKSLLLDSRVYVSRMSMAWLFSFLRDVSCMTNVESGPLSRTTFWWPEGHGFGSSEGGDSCSVSQGCEGSLGEMNGDTNFTSSIGLWLG